MGLRQIDVLHDWNATYKKYENLDYLSNFINLHRQSNLVDLNTTAFSSQLSLSKEQKNVLSILDNQIKFLQKKPHEEIKQVIMIQGKAGSGKSTLIQHITSRLKKEFSSKSYAILATLQFIPNYLLEFHTNLII